jgi:glycerophosphoryl diester phosphodiesterase
LPPYLQQAWLSPIIRPEALHPHFSLVNEGTMEHARAHGCAVNVWTVNDVAEARRLAALGVDSIITDVPDQIRAGLRAAA